MVLKNFLMISFALSLIVSSSRADIPLELKPSDEPKEEVFMTLSRDKAREVQECFDREVQYKKELIDDSSSWNSFLTGAAAGIAVGFILGYRH